MMPNPITAKIAKVTAKRIWLKYVESEFWASITDDLKSDNELPTLFSCVLMFSTFRTASAVVFLIEFILSEIVPREVPASVMG